MISGKVLNSLSSLNVLVTGGTGLIGRQIVKILCNAKANVKVVSLDNIVVDERAEYVKADLTDLNVCKQVTNGIDYVFHIAGIKGSIDVFISSLEGGVIFLSSILIGPSGILFKHCIIIDNDSRISATLIK